MKTAARLLLPVVTLLASVPLLLGQDPSVAPVILHSFTGTEPAFTYRSPALLEGSGGYFYGTTDMGGSAGDGKTFRITSTGAISDLHNFSALNPSGENADGAVPRHALVQASDGTFYGTTSQGGSSGKGTVFEMNTAGEVETMYNFSGADGANPVGSLVVGSDGNLYGTTEYGGKNSDGTVFVITPGFSLTTIHSFSYTDDGANPVAALIQGSDGNFYGTTSTGGTGFTGTVFEISPMGTTFNTLASFNEDDDGYGCYAPLVQDASGNFYGITGFGDDTEETTTYAVFGEVFELTSKGLTQLHKFTYGDGGGSYQGLVLASDGNVYGTTSGDSDDISSGDSTVFMISSSGSGFTTLHDFASGDAAGQDPTTLVQGSDGNFYGATGVGGSGGAGTVFKLEYVPAITNRSTVTAAAGKVFSYQITATNDPASYHVDGLFDGLKINTETGVISGTPTTLGAHTLTLHAVNALGTGSRTLAVTVENEPVVTSADMATAQVGVAFSYQITASNGPTSFGVGGLRPGLSVNKTTGLITGTPTGAGTFTLTLQAANAAGTGTLPLTLTIKPAKPVVTSSGTASAKVDQPFTYQITATNSPTAYGAGGLIAGFTANRQTGVLTGTPTAAEVGTHAFTLQAANTGGTGTKTLTLTVTAN